MPFKLKLKKSRQYNVSSKNLFVISVELLDNTTVECTLSAQSIGQECLANVCQRLGLHQPQYFGLRFLSKKGTYWWLDLQRPLKKQMDKYAQANSSLYLGVMYFVADVNMLHDEVTRYHYFLQLKSDIVESKLHCNEEQTVLFASYSLQAEFGDHDPERHTTEYLKNFGLLPKHMCGKDDQDVLLEKVIRTHQSLQGLSQQLAEVYYIMEAQHLNGYGQECFAGKDSSGTALFVCLSLTGIFIRYMNDQPRLTFLWEQIINLVHHKRCFGVEGRDSPKVIQVLMEDSHVAKYVWQTCIQQHQFYTKNENTAISPKITELLLGGTTVQKGSKQNSEEESSTAQNKSEETAVKYHLQESQESLDGLGVYHTEGCYSEMLTPSSMYKQLVMGDEKTSSLSLYQNVPLPNCSSTMASSTPVLEMSYPQVPTFMSSSVTQLQVQEVEEPPVYVQQQQQFPPVGESDHDSKYSSALPSYRQAPDYDTAVKLKYGFHSSGELSTSSPLIQSHVTVVARNPLDAYHGVSYQPAAPVQSYAQYKNYDDLSHLDANDLPQEGMEHVLPVRHYENIPVPIIHSPVHTYSSPELTSQSMMRDFSPNQVVTNIPMMYQFKPPPPYPYKQSSSTPDLTKSPQKHLQLNSSPNSFVVKDLNVPESSELSNNVYNYNVDSHQNILHQGQQEQNVHYTANVHPVTTGEPQNVTRIETPLPSTSQLPAHTYQNVQNVLQISVLDSIACQVTEPTFSTVMTAQSTKVTYQAPQAAPTTIVKTSDSLAPKNVLAAPGEKISPRKPANLALKNDSQGMGPMLVATMNGLTLSQPDILLAPSDDKKFPNDSRIQALETRLAEGQVFLEFEHVLKKKPMADFMTALMHENMPRNRFKDVFPYEENRVKLTPTSENKTGYINASHITVSVAGYQRFYIAAQGPLLNTLYSFWQMIWEHQVPVVVMLTEVQEEGLDKCFPYWPQEDNKSLQIGEFQISRNFSMSSPTYVTCSLSLCHITSHQQRSVWHIQYTDWPDHSCPEDVQGFLTFMSEVDAVRRLAVSQLPQVRQITSPIVVHCSAGVGRSGVVVLCDIMLQALDHNQPIDVPKVLTQLRLQRMLTVQTLAQYKFVYTVLVQYLRNSRLI